MVTFVTCALMAAGLACLRQSGPLLSQLLRGGLDHERREAESSHRLRDA